MTEGILEAKLACRKLGPGESGAYRALRLESLRRFPDSFGATYEEEASQARLPFEVAIEERSAEKFVVGTFAGDRLVAIAAFARVQGRKRRHRGDISGVFVDPTHRGRSVGEALMRKLLQLAFALDGVDQVELRVVSTNAAGLRLYAKLGFEQFGLQKDFFKDAGLRWDQCFMALTRERYVISLLTSR
jgi:RimJ/RimL family protein N-acetyltransferase